MQPEVNPHNHQNQISATSPANPSQFHCLAAKNFASIVNSKMFESEIIVNPILKRYLLLGYAAKGVIYFLIGILAIEAAILPEQKAAGTYTALKHLSGQPLGSILLCILALTLTGYVWRRLLQAIIYPSHSPDLSPRTILQRLGYILSSLSYAGIVYSALNIVFKLGKYNHALKHLIADLFKQPTGEAIVFLGGVAVFGVGLSYIYGAYTSSYICEFALSNPDLESYTKLIGKFGVATRGIAFAVTGVCLIQASLSSNADLAGGLQNAFQTIETQPLGWLWLGLIGSGFIAYGIYMFVAAAYRRYAIR